MTTFGLILIYIFMAFSSFCVGAWATSVTDKEKMEKLTKEMEEEPNKKREQLDKLLLVAAGLAVNNAKQKAGTDEKSQNKQAG